MDRPGVFDDDELDALYLDLTTQALQNGLQGDDIEPWIAQELATRVEDYEIISYLLLGQDPEHMPIHYYQHRSAHVYRLLDAIRQLPEVRAARQERFGDDETVDEEWMDDDDRSIFFGDF
jgi:hypothetical protein